MKHVHKDFSFELFLTGDERMFRKIFNDYKDLLYNKAFRILQESSSAEDVVAESLFKLWEYRMRIRDVDHMEAFLFIMIRNSSINALRRQRNIRTIPIEYTSVVEMEVEAKLNEMEYQKALNLIFELIDDLPKKQKRIIRLYYLEGMTPGEIGVKLQLSNSTVYSHLYKALANIRKKIQPLNHSFYIEIFKHEPIYFITGKY